MITMIAPAKLRSSWLAIWLATICAAAPKTPPADPFQEAVIQCTHADANIRLQGVKNILWGDSKAVPYLIRALKDPNGEVIVAAFAGLRTLRDPRAVKPLCEFLEPGTDRFYIGLAASALGEIGDPAAVPNLMQALTLANERNVRWDLASLMGKFGSAAVPSLLDLLKNPSPERRQIALWGLASCADPSTIDVIAQQFRVTEHGVTDVAEQALKRMAWEEVSPPMLKLLRDADPLVRRRAFAVLCHFRHRMASVATPLLRHQDEYIRTVVGTILRESEDTAHRLAPLFSPEKSVRLDTVRALELSYIPSEFLIEAVKKLVSREPDAEIREASAKLLGKMGDQAALALLAALQQDPDSKVRDAATLAMQTIAPNKPDLFKPRPK